MTSMFYCICFCTFSITLALNKVYISLYIIYSCLRSPAIEKLYLKYVSMGQSESGMLVRHNHNKVLAWLYKFTCTLIEVASFQQKFSSQMLGLPWKSICFSMFLDTTRRAEGILQVVKWDLSKQRFAT